MAPADALAGAGALLTPTLARAAAVFALQVLGAWGLGDWIVSAFRVPLGGQSRLARPLLSLAVGFGAMGQGLFLAGLVGHAYRKPIALPALIALALVGLFRLSRVRPRWGRPWPSGAGVFGWAVILLALVCAARWAWVLIGFGTGSDTYFHHYPFVKFSIRAGYFAHPMHLPFGFDNFSSYNPALTRMLWLPGHLLADERAANLFHWLSQLMMLAALYVFGRGVQSTRAGLLAVGIYLTIGLMGYNPLEAQDYTMTAMFLTLSLYLIVMSLRNGSINTLLLGGVVAGLMLSSKYYALPLAGLLTGLVLFWEPSTFRARFWSAFKFGATALVVFSPWLLYGLVTFHDPLYPFLRKDEEILYYHATEWVALLEPFVLPMDHSFLAPTVSYYLSMFIPFVGGYRTSGLSVIFLIGLPCSAYYLWRIRTADWRPIHALFILSIISFFALHLLVGRDAHYKWALFPGVIYAVSFGLLVDRLPRAGSVGLWLLTLGAAGLNYWYVSKPYMESYLPGLPATTQTVRWSEVDKYLNANAEQGAVISGTDAGYYLRPDLTGLFESSRVSFDWDAEERVIRKAGVRYMIVYPTELAGDARLNAGWAATWRQLSPGNTSVADYLDQSQRRHEERNRKKAEFLARYGTMIHQFANSGQLYRLRSDYP